MKKVLNWIEEIREEGQNTIKRNLELCLDAIKGERDLGGNKYSALLREISDLERDEALLSLFKKIVEDEHE